MPDVSSSILFYFNSSLFCFFNTISNSFTSLSLISNEKSNTFFKISQFFSYRLNCISFSVVSSSFFFWASHSSIRKRDIVLLIWSQSQIYIICRLQNSNDTRIHLPWHFEVYFLMSKLKFIVSMLLYKVKVQHTDTFSRGHDASTPPPPPPPKQTRLELVSLLKYPVLIIIVHKGL